jgi:hypothetical protein
VAGESSLQALLRSSETTQARKANRDDGFGGVEHLVFDLDAGHLLDVGFSNGHHSFATTVGVPAGRQQMEKKEEGGRRTRKKKAER